MEKILKDYLHLYIGCPVMTPDGIRELIGLNGLGNAAVKTFPQNISPSSAYWLYHVNTIKPILRPLSDKTEKEAKELAEQGHKYDSGNHESHIITDWAYKISYLLSKHFDIFGLIEAGLAIDKTLNQK